MTPPDPQQVAEIAGRLSKAQRDIFDAASLRGGDWCVYYINARSSMEALVRKGLVISRVGMPNCLSLLGVAVRNFIQGKSNAD